MRFIISFLLIIFLSSLSSNIAIADHNLSQIEKKCEVYKYSDSVYGDLDCSGVVDDRINLERNCEVYFTDNWGDIECRGTHYRDVEKRCEAYLYSSNYAEIDCR